MKVAPSIHHSLTFHHSIIAVTTPFYPWACACYCFTCLCSIFFYSSSIFHLWFFNFLLWFFQVWVIITSDHHLVWVVVVPCGSCRLILCCINVHELVDRYREHAGDFNLAMWATWSYYMSNKLSCCFRVLLYCELTIVSIMYAHLFLPLIIHMY